MLAGISSLLLPKMIYWDKNSLMLKKIILSWRCWQVDIGYRNMRWGGIPNKIHIRFFLLNPSSWMFLRPVTNCKISLKFAFDFLVMCSSGTKYVLLQSFTVVWWYVIPYSGKFSWGHRCSAFNVFIIYFSQMHAKHAHYTLYNCTYFVGLILADSRVSEKTTKIVPKESLPYTFLHWRGTCIKKSLRGWVIAVGLTAFQVILWAL